MKELLTLQGGYPRQMDYLLNLQTEILLLGNSLFGALAVDMVLSGCTVTNNGNGTVNIAPGLVYISGEAIRFDGANNIPSDGSRAFAKGAYIATDSKLFADGSPKNVYREAKANIVNQTPVNSAEIKVKATLYNLKQYIQDAMQSYEIKGTIKEIHDFDGTFLANFDESGLGISPRWLGWHLLNGNGDVPDGQGRALIGVGVFTDSVTGREYEFGPGSIGGEAEHKLTKPELPTNNVPLPNPSIRGRSDNANDRDVMIPTGAQSINVGGSDVPHNIMQPYLAVYRVIKIVD